MIDIRNHGCKLILRVHKVPRSGAHKNMHGDPGRGTHNGDDLAMRRGHAALNQRLAKLEAPSTTRHGGSCRRRGIDARLEKHLRAVPESGLVWVIQVS